MKTKKIFWLILLPFVLYAQSIFDMNTRANVWIEDGSNSKSFFVDGWSKRVKLDGTNIFVGNNLVSSFVSSDKLRVLVNDLPGSYPLANRQLPYLSLVGFDQANSLLGDGLNEPSLSISPDGGAFNKTIEVVFTLNAPADTESTVVYNIDGGDNVQKMLVSNDTNGSFVIYLTKEGDHNISYALKSEDKFRVAHFTLTNHNAKRDSDGDGIPDSVEAELGMDPFDTIIPDSDNDGWNDWEAYVRDENTTDSDGDGWSDWDEVNLRATNPNNPKACVDAATKPTANSLYGVEYLFPTLDMLLPSIERASLVNVKSDVLLDTTNLIEREAIQDSEQQLCAVSPSDLNLSLSQGSLPQMRVPADLAIIERIREYNPENNSSQVLKAWTDAVAPLTLNDYLASEKFATLGDNFNATQFKESYITFLKENLIIENHNFSANRANSIKVGLVESAMRSRDDSPVLLLLGDPDFKIPLTTYTHTLKALGEENRTMNDLYRDLLLVSKGENIVDKAVEAFNHVDENTTEERVANYLQNGIVTRMKYKLSLMTILGIETASKSPSVLDLNVDSDGDTLLNKDEVFPIYYTHPLKGDSDNDGVDDKDDACPNDLNNECINDDASTEDTDGDGINDAVDNCPFDTNLEQEDSDGDGIGDVCARKGIVMVTPRTNIQLFKGDVFNFEAIKTVETESEVIWFINDTAIEHLDLTFAHTFNTVGKERVCIALLEEKDTQSCIDVHVLERDNHANLNIYTNDAHEGDSGDKNLLVELVLDRALDTDVRYAYETEAGTATKDVDYRTISGSVTFEAGEVRKYLTVPIVGDLDIEEDENFTLKVGDSIKKVITIIDDDVLPTLSMDNPYIETTEGTGSNHTVTFNFHLDVAPKTSATVDISPIAQNIAELPTIGTISGNGKVTFEAGETTARMEVEILGDGADEYDKTVHICLQNPQNLKFEAVEEEGDTSHNPQYDNCVAVGVIDDDEEPTVSFDPTSLTVSEATGKVYGTLKLSHLSTKGASAFVSVSNETNASSGDYAFNDVNVSFFDMATTSYVTERRVELNITDDDEVESLEKVVLEISSTQKCTAVETNKRLTVNITDNDIPDPLVTVSMFDGDGTELNDGNVTEGDVDKNVTFRLTLSSPVTKEGTQLHYSIPMEIESIPTGYPNYHSMIKSVEGDIAFGVGEQVKEFNVTIIGDMVNESNKAFVVRLSDAINIRLHDLPPHIIIEHPERKDVGLYIVDNDPMPMVSFEHITYDVQEGQQAHVKLMLSGKSYQTVEVNLTVHEDSTAEDSEDMDIDDYNLSTQHVVILATSPSSIIPNLEVVVDINTSQNLDGEDDETIILDMNSSKNASINLEGNRTVVTIAGDINPPLVVDAGENKTVQLGGAVTITGTASDDSAIVSSVWKEGADVLANTLSFSYTPSSVGIKTLTLTVTDDDGATVSDTMEVNVTEADDATPNAFSFTDLTDVELSEEQNSSMVVQGINVATAISVVGGEYSVDNGVTWLTVAGSVENNTRVWVRHTSSAEYLTDVNTTLTIGGVSDIFTSRTKAFADQAPVVRLSGSEEIDNKEFYIGENPYVDAMMSDDVGVKHCAWTDDNGDTLIEEDINPAEPNPYGVCKLQLDPFTTTGAFNYYLTATDTQNQISTNTLHITVLPNSIPTADVGGNRTIKVDRALTITATADDADDDDDSNTLTYQWMYGLKGGTSMYSGGNTLTFTHTFDTVAEYLVTFRASDRHNASVTKELDVNVTQEEVQSTPLSKIIFFKMNNGSDGFEPWTSDGSEANTTMLKDLLPTGNSDPSNFTRVGDNIYFLAYDADYNSTLYISDGSSENTLMLKSFGSAQVENLLDVNGVLYFTVNNDGNSLELWKSAGTEETTQKVKTLFSGYGIEKMVLTLIGDTFYFASGSDGDIELYKYNITTDILSLVKDLKEGSEGSFPHEMINVNGVLYFTANGNEIWKSEGTSDSTVIVAQLHSDPDAWFDNLTYTNGIIYFTSSSGATTALNALNVSSGVTTSKIAEYTDNIMLTHTATMGNKFYYTTSSHKVFNVLGDVVTEELETTNYIFDLKIVGETFYIHQSDALIASTGIVLKSLSNEERVDFVQATLNDELFFYIYKDTQDGSFVSLWKTDGTMGGTQELVPYRQAK